ncbi:MAG: hypothetical protein ATN36_06385 [Epulopiscium sp. Nele67-Bin005]|nr:MAG: hypothetical protein ATN36_06385 [Epulopiscium sp. Nele67-Bin005]
MSDQASRLRDMIQNKEFDSQKPFRIITVTSGKGGVGKSNFSANLSVALKNLGQKPIILDADFGLANIDLILGQRPTYSLAHLIEGGYGIKDIITYTPHDVPFISGGSGVREMLFLKDYQLDMIAEELSKLTFVADTLIIDTGAGINDTVIKFCEMADDVCLVITPDPSSITDAYALIKTFVRDLRLKPNFTAVVNRVDSQQEADAVYRKIAVTGKNFLGLDIKYGGCIPYDPQLVKAIKAQQPIQSVNANAPSSLGYTSVARKLLNMSDVAPQKESLKDKFRRILANKNS